MPSCWLFCDTPIGGVYGASYLAESWARELRALGWAVRVVAPSGSFAEQRRTAGEISFRTLRHVGYPGDQHACFSMAAELLRARGSLPDVVLVLTPLRIGMLGFALAHYCKVPLVVAVSTDTTGMAQYYSSVRMIAASWPKVAAITVGRWAVLRAILRRHAAPRTAGNASARLAARVVEAWHGAAAELVLLGEQSRPARAPGPPATLCTAGVARLPETADASPVAWPGGALRVLYVGRFSREKTLPLLLRATAIARNRGLHLHLALVGGGHLHADLHALAADLGIGEHITLLDALPRHGLRPVYAGADVFAFPSVVDTQAFVLNEAAHEALPLLVAGQINPVIADEETALVVGHSADGFADGLLRLADPALRRRLGEKARERALQYTEAGQARRLAAILTRAASRACPHPAASAGGPHDGVRTDDLPRS